MDVPGDAGPRRSAIAPLSADEREQGAQREVALALADRLLSEQVAAQIAHLVLLGVAVWLLAGAVRTPLLVGWAGAVAVAVGVRGLLMSRVKGLLLPPESAARSVRLSVVMLGLAWGVGVALIAPDVPFRYVTLLMVTEAGLVAGAAWTLTADLWSFRLFLLCTLGPLPFGILANGTARPQIVAVTLILLFAAYMWVQGRRAHDALAGTLRTAALLRIREADASRQHSLLASLFAGAPVAMAELDADGVIERINPRFATLFGFPEDQAVGQVLEELLVPHEQRAAVAADRRAVLAGQVISRDLRRRTKDGQTVDVLMSAAPLEREDGSKGLVVLYEDVSERRRSEARVAELAGRLEAVLGAATQVSIIATDLRGVITVFNAGAEQMLGYRAADVVGYEPFERLLLHGEIEARARDIARRGGPRVDGFDVLVESARQGGYDQHEWTYVRKDGKRLTVELVVTAVRDAAGAVTGFLGVAMDVTQRNRAAAALREAEAHFRQLLDSSGEGIYGVDTTGRCTFFNPAATALTGYSQKDALGRDSHQLLHHTRPDGTPYPRDECPVVRALLSGTGVRIDEELYWRQDGTPFPVSLTAFPLREGDGSVSGAVVTFSDTSERVAAREAIQHAREAAERAAQTRSAFLANMSHEIRTPLNAILGLTELLFDTPLQPEQHHSLDLVRGAGETLLTLLNDILDLSKIEADQLAFESIPFDPGRLVESTLALLAVRGRAKRLELITDIAPGVPPSVRGDPTRLRQILTNLIGNAIKFTDRGEVAVTLSRTETPDPERAVLRFGVRDTGIGIPADKLESVFEEFTQADSSTTRRYGGTGLGLAIARRLVRLQGGELRVTSEVGRGTEFSFSLGYPIDRPAETSGTPATLRARVLVVDDNATNRRIVRDMLQAAGARVDERDQAREVPEVVRAARKAGTPYQLLILDAQMPDYDGFGLARELRQDPDLADLRLLLLTSAAQPGDGQRCRELGIQGYLPKPASRADLLEAVGAVLAGRGQAVVTRHSLAEARRPLRILLAEDNPVNQQVAATMLRKRGHRVDVANNGREAVQQAARERYDVVLMDVQMPELDGVAATAAIRALPEGRTLPIVALTAHALSGERERCLAAGMTGYLSKPFKPHELFAAAEGAAQGDQPGGPSAAPAAPAADAGGPAPAADLERLRRELTEAGAAEALGPILDTFLLDAPTRLQALLAAVAAGDAAATARAAHAFRSAAATIGAAGLAALLSEMESRAKAGAMPEVREAIPRARGEVDRVLAQIAEARPAV